MQYDITQLDTAEISDALDAIGIEGALLGIKAQVPGAKIFGPAFTVKYSSYENKPTEFKNAGNYIDDVPANAVIIVDNDGREDCTTWGDILTQVAIKNSIAGTVIHGTARDINYIRTAKYPLFANSIYMRSGKNRVYKSDQQCTLTINNVVIEPGDFIFGDDNGVVVIPQGKLNDVVEKAFNIKMTEQQIIKSIQSGIKLEEARKLHRYDQPWLGKK